MTNPHSTSLPIKSGGNIASGGGKFTTKALFSYAYF
jgi:hypothetical protein